MSKKHIKVLFLDDEEGNLNAFKAAFRRDYDVYVAQTPEKAFEIIEAIQPPVIITDQRMPRMSGVEFLNVVRQTHPESMRLLITAYADLKDIIDAINRIKEYLQDVDDAKCLLHIPHKLFKFPLYKPTNPFR